MPIHPHLVLSLSVVYISAIPIGIYRFLSTANSATMNILIHISFVIGYEYTVRYILRTRIDGPEDVKCCSGMPNSLLRRWGQSPCLPARYSIGLAKKFVLVFP